jgi:hypothetical protein
LKEPPQNAADRVEMLAADGFSMRGVAAGFGISADTLRRWLDEHPELQEAFDRGRERERQTLHNTLYRAATEKGNMTAAMFLLKARHGYREGDQTAEANRVSINFTLPAAMPMEAFRIVENGNPGPQPEPAATARLAGPRGD